MKKKSIFTMCITASLIVSTFGATVVMAEEYEESVYEEPVYEEPVYEEPVYEEPVYEESTYTEPDYGAYEESASQSSSERTLIDSYPVYDCDDSGNGYYVYVYSNGDIETENFYASSSGSSSGSSAESSYDSYDSSSETSYDSYEESSDEDAASAEESSDEVVEEVAESSEVIFDGTEWTVEQIAAIPDVISGVENKEYTAGSASKYDIHMGVDFDSDIVHGVLFRTCDVDSSTPGEYDVTYLVYFNREALIDYMEENGIDAADFPGLEDESSDRIEIDVYGKVVID